MALRVDPRAGRCFVTAVVLPEIDAVTVEELRPPCETTKRAHMRIVGECDQPASWVVRIRCEECGHVGPSLQCDQHKAYYVEQHGRCGCCECGRLPMRYTCLSAERL